MVIVLEPRGTQKAIAMPWRALKMMGCEPVRYSYGPDRVEKRTDQEDGIATNDVYALALSCLLMLMGTIAEFCLAGRGPWH